ncbi:MAG: AEC family transporter [Gammaproteobacteria bacterium]|nr:AEC family transporter [Gammaproteobacteria bacterium]
MQTILIAIFPLLLIIAMGYIARRSQWINDAFLDGLSSVTFTVFIPCLLFLSIYSSEDLTTVSLSLLLSFYLPVISIFIVSFIVYRLCFIKQFQRTELLSLAATFSNNVLIGIPILLSIIGESVLLPGFVIVSIHSLILFTLTSLFGSQSQGQSSWYRSIGTSLWLTTRSPIVISLILGLVAKLLLIELHPVFTNTLTFLKGAALPCALIVLGATLARYRVSNRLSLTVAVAGVKLLVLPLCIYLTATQVFELSLELTAVAVVMAASPVGINVFMFAARDQQASPYLASAILSSTLLSIITIPLWIWFLGLT